MKSFLISTIICIISSAIPLQAKLNPSTIDDEEKTILESSIYDVGIKKYKSVWEHLIPNQFITQYAGSIGIVNFGLGWHYHRHHWETQILGGWVPGYTSDDTKGTLTLKQCYIPWRIKTYKQWDIEPLTTGMFFNTIFGENFWGKEPSRYPANYYGFSTKIRVNIFLGQQIRYNIPNNKRLLFKSISFYYELSTCDLYVVSAFNNSNVHIDDILSLAIGLKLELF